MAMMKSGYIKDLPNNGGHNMPETFLTCPTIKPFGRWRSDGYTYGLYTTNNHFNLMNMARSKYRRPIIADSIQDPFADPVKAWYHFYTHTNNQRMLDCRHNRKANAGFDDGSVSAIGVDYFSEWSDRTGHNFYYYLNGAVGNGK